MSSAYFVFIIALFQSTLASTDNCQDYYVSNDCQSFHSYCYCANLSYYAENSMTFFRNDTIFYFSKGVHILNGSRISVTGVSNVTLEGMSDRQVDQFVVQPDSIVTCVAADMNVISFNNSSNIVIRGLSIMNCTSTTSNCGICINHVQHLLIEQVLIQNIFYGAHFENAFHVSIIDSSFVHNFAGMYIKYTYNNAQQSRFNVINSNFSSSGLCTHCFNTNNNVQFYFRDLLIHFSLTSLDNYISIAEGSLIGGIISQGCMLNFEGYNYFINNTGSTGGALTLYDSYIVLDNTDVYFINNSASIGGAIYIANSLFSPCFYQTKGNSNLVFINNMALVTGDAIYGYISDCSNTDDTFDLTLQNGLSVISSDSVEVCFCVEGKPNCSNYNMTFNTFHGGAVNIPLAVLGDHRGLTLGALTLIGYFNDNILFTKDVPIYAQCTNIPHTVLVNESIDSFNIAVSIVNSLVNSKSLNITFNVDKCSPGFFEIMEEKCVCRSTISTIEETTCDVNTETISRDGNVWIGFKNANCLIVYSPCTFDYCKHGNVTFNYDNIDAQCAFNRSGILCGQCAEGLSLMLGTNQCGECNNGYIALIIPFALAGVAIVILLIALNMTVSMGTINGLIFYANIVQLYQPLLFPRGPVPVLSQFISWINLDLGINVCFYNGMGSCSKIWLQYVFPIYIWLIIGLIIVLARYSTKISKLVSTNIISVLATMILLSYTKLMLTAIQALYFAPINCTEPNGAMSTSSIWFIDPNIPYLHGCHLPLFLFSLSVICFLIVPYTLYLISIPLLERNIFKCICCRKLRLKMKPFSDAYGGPYRDKYRYWAGLLLLVRVLLAVVVSFVTKRANIDVAVPVFLLILFLQFLLQVYRSYYLILLDAFFLCNLLLLIHYNLHDENQNGEIASYVLVSMSLIVFIGIIVYHIWQRLSIRVDDLKESMIEKMKQLMQKKRATLNKLSEPTNDRFAGSEMFSPASALFPTTKPLLKRETLIYDD